jgi:hypothetical protein
MDNDQAVRSWPLVRLHAAAAALDLAALTLLMLQALFLVPPAEADRRILILILSVVPVAFLVFALMPRRVLFKPETEVPHASLMVYASLGLPVAAGLITLTLVAVSGSFDSFAGFGLLIAADAGRNLLEGLRQRTTLRGKARS